MAYSCLPSGYSLIPPVHYSFPCVSPSDDHQPLRPPSLLLPPGTPPPPPPVSSSFTMQVTSPLLRMG